MAEHPHYGRGTWFGGTRHCFHRFDQILKPNGGGIGARYRGTAHQRLRYASKAWATKMLMLNKTPAAAMTSPIASPCREGESSIGLFQDDFTDLGKWFRRPHVGYLITPNRLYVRLCAGWVTNTFANRLLERQKLAYSRMRDRFHCVWRKGWDSNPRYPCRHAGFQDRCLKPLGHPSVFGVQRLSRGTGPGKVAIASPHQGRRTDWRANRGAAGPRCRVDSVPA